MAQSASTGNYLLPKTIQHNLNRYSINQVDLPFQFFKGILNFKLKRKKNQQKKNKRLILLRYIFFTTIHTL